MGSRVTIEITPSGITDCFGSILQILCAWLSTGPTFILPFSVSRTVGRSLFQYIYRCVCICNCSECISEMSGLFLEFVYVGKRLRAVFMAFTPFE